MSYWNPAQSGRAEIVQVVEASRPAHTGKQSLRVYGNGAGVCQLWEQTPIGNDTSLEFYCFLQGRDQQAFLELFFHERRDSRREVLHIRVTSMAGSNYEEAIRSKDYIYVWQQGCATSKWVRILLYPYSLIRKHFGYSSPYTSGILVGCVRWNPASYDPSDVGFDDIQVPIPEVTTQTTVPTSTAGPARPSVTLSTLVILGISVAFGTLVAFLSFRHLRRRRKTSRPASETGNIPTFLARLEELRLRSEIPEQIYERLKKEYIERIEKRTTDQSQETD